MSIVIHCTGDTSSHTLRKNELILENHFAYSFNDNNKTLPISSEERVWGILIVLTEYRAAAYSLKVGPCGDPG